jgi:hypothetical protein
MPRPSYIICAQHIVEDKRTSLVSLFNIVERVEIHPLPTVDGPIFLEAMNLHFQAVWMREDGDNAQDEFEHQLLITSTAADPIIGVPVTFRFENPLQRFAGRIQAHLMFAGPGTMRVESRIRRVGSDGWLTQDYLIPVELAELRAEDQQADPENEGGGR